MSYFSYISSFFSKPAELSYLAETLEPAIQAAEQQKKSFTSFLGIQLHSGVTT